ncbi:MAG: excinuclease ABC subunit UvrA [Pirellulales bacterium]|nr:excinuclease ABC subunit UvrA [Pirellulales bacterium]
MISSGKSSAPDGQPEFIRLRGVRVHNLKNLDVDIPRDRLVVLTGLSGSGKSSLAFDTLYAEGQRQYVESLSAYARQFLHQLERPDVDLIDGLQPTIAVEQRAGSQNPRSTVATVTEIYDYLRLLMARCGLPHCYICGEPIRQQTPEAILDRLMSLPEKNKAMILAPVVRGRKGQHREVFESLEKAGFVRVRVDGIVYELSAVPELTRQKNHDIEAVVDRVIIREGIRPRLAESINLAIRHGDGLVIVSYHEAADDGPGTWCDVLFSIHLACPRCQISYEEIEPRSFSFNSPHGACPTCEGLGARVEFDPDLVLPDRSLSLAEGAIAPWKNGGAAAHKRHDELLKGFAKANRVDLATPLADWKPAQLEKLLRGDARDFAGLLVLLEQEYVTAMGDTNRERLERFRGSVRCPDCDGARLRPEARHVLVDGTAIQQFTALSVDDARPRFASIEFDEADAPIGEPLIAEISKRLDFLAKVGLGYLTLDRAADTLSGGEAQRIRLATGLGSGLVGVCYVLDEPSIGLHPRDNDRLIDALCDLRQQGNSVVVVEHDEAMIRVAEHLIDLGPGAGREGGHLVAQGTLAEVEQNPASLTGRYLSGQARIEVPSERRATTVKHSITLEGATLNNLKDVSARFPLGALVCITGVSGSGKSSLMNETLARALARKLGNNAAKPGPYSSLRGASQIDKLVEIDQSPIGRTPRSNPATFTGLFDEIRKVFVATREAKLRGYKVGRFSFNVKGGRCEHCQGQGVEKIEMNFLPDLHVPCPVCEGARFNRQTLEVRYRGLNIAEVLDLGVEEACGFFENYPAIVRMLDCLRDVGLGYVSLGQSSTTLSGGEAQRIKLAAELGRPSTGHTLYLLDEPTTGLHFEDVRRLLGVLNRLVDVGNTVIVIEHHLDVIKSSDWLIDLGPEGGAAGGQIIATGTPEEVAAVAESHTGTCLRGILTT